MDWPNLEAFTKVNLLHDRRADQASLSPVQGPLLHLTNSINRIDAVTFSR